MKKVYAIAAIALLLGLSSCLSTVQPIFTEKDLVFDARLLGKWGYESSFGNKKEDTVEQLKKNPGAQRRAQRISNVTVINNNDSVMGSYSGYTEITRATAKDVEQYPALQGLLGKMYMIKYMGINGNVESAYYGFLVKLGQKYYMDYYPAETAASGQYNSFYKSHYTKMHTCFSINFQKNNSFTLKQFDEKFLRSLIDNKKIRISHETTVSGDMIVTASTQELQQYIMKYSDIPEAYYSENTSIYTRVLSH